MHLSSARRSRRLVPLVVTATLALGACTANKEPADPAAIAAAGPPTSTATGTAVSTVPASAAPAPVVSIVPGTKLKRTQRWTAARKRIALAKRVEQAARRAAAQNPLAGHEWGVYRGDADQAWGPYAASSGTNRALLAKISERPKAQWFGAWISDADIASKVEDYIANAQDGDPDKLVQMAVFRMVPWEREACGRLPSAAEQASYKRWIDSFASAVGDTPAAIILQPDGPFALCVPGDSSVSSDLVAYAAQKFGALPETATYLDAGAADWPAVGQGGVPKVLDFLIPAGIEDVRGIAMNSTHYTSVTDEVARGTAIVEALAARGITGKKVVISTSSNGRPFVFGDAPGSDPDNATVCATPSSQACVTLGIPPTTDVANPKWGLSSQTNALAEKYVDGYLWFGRPWLYRQNSPFDLGRALALARTTPY